jgi:hypothetical protein
MERSDGYLQTVFACRRVSGVQNGLQISVPSVTERVKFLNKILTSIQTNSMGQLPSREHESRSAFYKLVRVLWNLNDHDRVHMKLRPVLRHRSPLYILSLYLFNVLSNTIFRFLPRSCKFSLCTCMNGIIQK